LASCTIPLTGVAELISLSVLLAIFVISIIFMFGRAIRSQTIEAWVKLELYQVLATILFVAGSLLFIGIVCGIDVTFFSDYLGTGPGKLIDTTNPMFPADANILDASGSYLIWLQEKIHGCSVATDPACYTLCNSNPTQCVFTSTNTYYGYYEQVKHMLMLWEVQASTSEYYCPFLCLIMPNGWSIDPGSGFYTKMSAGYMGLQTITMAMLSVSSLLFMLAYAVNGALLWLFPIGAFFRSIPYMRGFGGALMALALTLYIGLPFILFTNALLAYIPIHDVSITPNLPFSCVENGGGSCIMPMAQQAAAAAFATVFMPALDFIFLAAIGRELSHLFGSELDMTALSQLV
jgi:hypothetical protein